MRTLAIAIACCAVWPLAACSPIVALESAPDAASPECAAVSVRLPDAIGDLMGRETNAQATAAWGEPTAVILHCGVPAPPPTSDLICVTVPDGKVDWLRDDNDQVTYIFTSYGRTPAVSVAIDSTMASGLEVLDAIDAAVSTLPQDGACL